MKVEDIREILEAFDQSDAVELKICADADRIHIRKQGAFPCSHTAQAGTGINTAATDSPEAAADFRVTEVRAPLAGIFYRAASPEAEPFVKVGSRVKQGEVIGLIEAMKVISEIPSPCDGEVLEIAADNAAFSAYDALLMRIGEGHV